MAGHDIFVIGASAGGLDPIMRLVEAMPANLPASVFVCLHISPHAPSALPAILARKTSMRVADVSDGARIEPRVIYIATPDHHLLIRSGNISLTRGPKENGHRPSIDALFRSAAAYYKSRVVGVILSGTLDDGTAGLSVVKELGGVTIVQDPKDAAFAGMLNSAIENVKVDHILPADDIARCMIDLADDPAAGPSNPAISEQQAVVLAEALDDAELRETPQRAGTPSIYSCPDCNGVLWEIEDGNIVRYRCRTGHAFSDQSLLSGQTNSVETALWTAVRALDERRDLLIKLANRARQRGQNRSAV